MKRSVSHVEGSRQAIGPLLALVMLAACTPVRQEAGLAFSTLPQPMAIEPVDEQFFLAARSVTFLGEEQALPVLSAKSAAVPAVEKVASSAPDMLVASLPPEALEAPAAGNAPLDLEAVPMLVEPEQAGGKAAPEKAEKAIVVDAPKSTSEASIPAPSPIAAPVSESIPVLAKATPSIVPVASVTPTVAPPTPSITEEVWQASPGQTLREVLADWSAISGAQLRWKTAYDYPVQATFEYKGDYAEAVRAILTGFASASPQPVGRLHLQGNTGRRVLLIEARGNSYKE